MYEVGLEASKSGLVVSTGFEQQERDHRLPRLLWAQTGTELARGGWYHQIGAVLMAPLGLNRTRTGLEQNSNKEQDQLQEAGTGTGTGMDWSGEAGTIRLEQS